MFAAGKHNASNAENGAAGGKAEAEDSSAAPKRILKEGKTVPVRMVPRCIRKGGVTCHIFDMIL